MRTDSCQRWKGGRASYRPAREVIDPSRYEVAAITGQGADTIAKGFVAEHHYSGTYPAARYRFGLYQGAELVGCAVFSVPCRNVVITNHIPVEDWRSCVELGRLVLLDEVPANAESWFVASCFRQLRREGIAGVVSFSDPMPRPAVDGTIVMPGHVGTVYQALNATYVGQSRVDTMRMLPDGTILSSRAVAKIRKLDQGHVYVEAQLVGYGASPRGDQDPNEWLAAELPSLVRKLRHPGNHKYVWALDKRLRRQLQPSLPYPKVTAPFPAALLRRAA
jgi:hypothetical protein